jgi:hypothetical protein
VREVLTVTCNRIVLETGELMHLSMWTVPKEPVDWFGSRCMYWWSWGNDWGHLDFCQDRSSRSRRVCYDVSPYNVNLTTVTLRRCEVIVCTVILSCARMCSRYFILRNLSRCLSSLEICNKCPGLLVDNSCLIHDVRRIERSSRRKC